MPVRERFDEKCRAAPNGCIEWTAGRNQHGYGEFWDGKRHLGAHRWAYEQANGPIPDGLFVLHTCDNPACVNPAHLWAGTQAENIQDAGRKGRINKTVKLRLEDHPNATTTNEQAIEVVRLLSTGIPQTEIARRVLVSKDVVHQIKSGATWRTLPRHQVGFTLIELLISVAIVGVLAAIAIPQYAQFVIRSKLAEVVTASTAAKHVVSEAYTSDGSAGVVAAAAGYNIAADIGERSSKFVADSQIDPTNGTITMTVTSDAASGFPAEVRGRTLVFTPNVQKQPLGSLIGAIDWACASATAATAGNRGLTGVTLGTLPAKYAPAECR